MSRASPDCRNSSLQNLALAKLSWLFQLGSIPALPISITPKKMPLSNHSGKPPPSAVLKQTENIPETVQDVKESESFFCKLCSEHLKTELQVKAHLKVHAGKKSVECFICSKILATTKNLQKHVREVHLNERPHTCEICSKGFKRHPDLKMHMTDIHGKGSLHVCTLCGQGFTLKHKLRRHVSDVHNTKLPVESFFCDAKSFQKSDFNGVAMSPQSKSQYARKTEKAMALEELEERALRKLSWLFRLGSIPALPINSLPESETLASSKQHSHSNIHVEETIKGEEYEELSKNEEEDEEFHKCPKCPKKYRLKNSLRKHIPVHNEVMPFTCLNCSRGFTQKANLERHVRTHTKEKQFQCSFCQRYFSQKSNLESHISAMHLDYRNFECMDCGKRFVGQYRLKRHWAVIHGKFTQHQCKECKGYFQSAKNLERHMTSLHQSRDLNTKKQLKCPSCSAIFTTKAHLTRHLVRLH